MIYEEYGTSSSSTYSRVIDVYPNEKYSVQIEVLRSGLGGSDDKVSNIIIDGISVGECNPPGSDSDCDFYNCGSQLGSTIFSSITGKIPVDLEYVGNSYECNCDTAAWTCSSGIDSLFKTPMLAAARVTFKPWGKQN